MTKKETNALADAIAQWNQQAELHEGRNGEPIYQDAIHMITKHIKSRQPRFNRVAFHLIAAKRTH